MVDMQSSRFGEVQVKSGSSIAAAECGWRGHMHSGVIGPQD